MKSDGLRQKRRGGRRFRPLRLVLESSRYVAPAPKVNLAESATFIFARGGEEYCDERPYEY
jgi:hypothetical protein